MWQGRNRRPPKDPINAMLSLGYTMLEKEIRIGLLVAKLDCRFGFFHSNNGRKDSLVFDMMDLFRQDIIDRMVITFINKKMFTQDDFHYFDNACFFTESGRKKFFLRYEEFIVLKKAGEISKREKIIQSIKDFAVTRCVQHLQLSISYFVVRLIVQYISVVCRSSYIQIKSKASS